MLIQQGVPTSQEPAQIENPICASNCGPTQKIRISMNNNIDNNNDNNIDNNNNNDDNNNIDNNYNNDNNIDNNAQSYLQ
jgi:hypothetical protein